MTERAPGHIFEWAKFVRPTPFHAMLAAMHFSPTRAAGTLSLVVGLSLVAACSEPEGTSFDSLDGVGEGSNSNATAPGGGVFWSEAMLHDEILRHNPDYDRDGVFQISGGRPVGMSLANTRVLDLGFVVDLPLQALELTGTQVSDLAPLSGLPLRELWLERTEVEDLTPLRDMPLQKLHLSMTRVADLSGLEGAPLRELNLSGTNVSDLSPLEGAPIETLWLNGCPVSDLSPLAGMPMIDLTLSGTEVRDLGPLAKTRLLRLYLGELPITDLTPLLQLRLTRLVFRPEHVEQGLDDLRQLESLREIGTRLDELGNDLQPPTVFWAQLDGRLTRPEPYDTAAFLPDEGSAALTGDDEEMEADPDGDAAEPTRDPAPDAVDGAEPAADPDPATSRPSGGADPASMPEPIDPLQDDRLPVPPPTPAEPAAVGADEAPQPPLDSAEDDPEAGQ